MNAWNQGSQICCYMRINELSDYVEELTHPDEFQLQKLRQLWAQLHNAEEGGDDVMRAVPDVTDLLQATRMSSCQSLEVIGL